MCLLYKSGFFSYDKGMITFTQADGGKSVEVPIGEDFEVRLDENPTTGYRWAVEPGSQDAVTLTRSDFIRSAGGGFGVGGVRVFTFHTEKTGPVSLNFKHWREWAGDDSVVARFTIIVKISG